MHKLFVLRIVTWSYNNNDNNGKLVTIYKTLHPRDNLERLYLSRKGSGKWLTSIQDRVDVSIKWLEDYINIQRKTGYSDQKQYKKSINWTKITRKHKWEERKLYGQCKRQISKTQ